MDEYGWKLRVKFAEDQPRVPAGSSEGGQWTGGYTGTMKTLKLSDGKTAIVDYNPVEEKLLTRRGATVLRIRRKGEIVTVLSGDQKMVDDVKRHISPSDVNWMDRDVSERWAAGAFNKVDTEDWFNQMTMQLRMEARSTTGGRASASAQQLGKLLEVHASPLEIETYHETH